MADPVEVANAAADLADKTVLLGESDQEVTGLKSFKRAPDAPYDVEAGSAVVPNLDADLLDGEEGSAYHNASNLNSGTIPAARFPDPLPAVSGENLHTLDASKLTGTIPDASVPDPLPAVSGAALTAVPNPLPAVSGENLTGLDATELVGDIPDESVPTYVDGDLTNAKKKSIVCTIYNPAGISEIAQIPVWLYATKACHVVAVKGYRKGGDATIAINGRRAAGEPFLASSLVLTSDETVMDGGTVQNTVIAVGTMVEAMLTVVSGSPTKVVIQIDLAVDDAS